MLCSEYILLIAVYSIHRYERKGSTGMYAIETAKRLRTPHYLITLKLYVQPDGSLLVMMGNASMEVTQDEVHALLCGTLEFANVFSKLHQQVDATTLEILSENGKMEAQAFKRAAAQFGIDTGAKTGR